MIGQLTKRGEIDFKALLIYNINLCIYIESITFILIDEQFTVLLLIFIVNKVFNSIFHSHCNLYLVYSIISSS